MPIKGAIYSSVVYTHNLHIHYTYISAAMNTKPFSLVLILLLLIVSPLTSARKLFAETQVSASGDLGKPAKGHIGYKPLKKQPICYGTRYRTCLRSPPKKPPCNPYRRNCN